MDRQRKVVFGPLPPPYGGVSIFISSLRERLGPDVEIWSYTGAGAAGPGARVKYVPHRRLEHLRRLLTVGRNARIIDSTHFHLEYPNPLLVRLWITLHAALKFRWIKVLHDGSLPSRFQLFTPGERRAFFAAIRHIDEAVVVTEELAGFLRQHRPDLSVTCISPLLPPTDGWLTGSSTSEFADVLERFSSHRIRVCSVGAFIPSYGFHHVAEAVERLRQSTGNDIGLMLIAGDFADEDAYREKVLAGRDWIQAVRGVPHDVLPRFYRQSNVMVRSFAHESYGLSRIEALWCGIPVIATAVGETRGMLTFEFGDVEQLVAHMRGVLLAGSAENVSAWANMYTREAQQNLRAWLEIIEGAPRA